MLQHSRGEGSRGDVRISGSSAVPRSLDGLRLEPDGGKMSLENVPAEYAATIIRGLKLGDDAAQKLLSKAKAPSGRAEALREALAGRPTLLAELEEDWPFDNRVGLEIYELGLLDGVTPKEFAADVRQTTHQELIRRVPLAVKVEPVTAPPESM